MYLWCINKLISQFGCWMLIMYTIFLKVIYYSFPGNCHGYEVAASSAKEITSVSDMDIHKTFIYRYTGRRTILCHSQGMATTGKRLHKLWNPLPLPVQSTTLLLLLLLLLLTLITVLRTSENITRLHLATTPMNCRQPGPLMVNLNNKPILPTFHLRHQHSP